MSEAVETTSLHGVNSFTTPVTNVLIAGTGTDTLGGGTVFFSSAVTNIFVYNLGTDTITNFRAGSGSGDLIDLSAIPGISSFSDVQALTVF